MRPIYLIYGLLLAQLTLLGYLMLVDEPELATGAPHAQFVGMNVGGDGLARLGSAGAVIGAIGGLSVAVMLLLVTLGVNASRRTVLFWLLIAVVALASQGVWWAMYLGYLSFLETGQVPFVLGFPLPTSWMLYGVWGSGALLSLVYIFGFRRFIFTEDDEAAYEALRAAAEVPRAPEQDALG